MSLAMQVYLFSFLPLLLAILFFKSYFSTSKSRINLPSPPKLPLIGNLHQLGSAPHHVLQSMAQTYGPLMLLHFGTVPVVIVSSVDTAREIMKTHDVIFSSRPFVKTVDLLTYGSKDIAFSKYGEYWRQLKSISVLHLLNNKRVKSYNQVREDEVAQMMKKILEADKSVVNLSELLLSLTNNVICRVAFGRTYEGDISYKNSMHRIGEALGNKSIGSYIPWLAWVDKLSGLHDKIKKLAKEIDDFNEVVIDEHINKKNVGVQGKDFVDILLECQRDNSTGFILERYMIKAILQDIFGAGTDTTFTGLQWAFAELLRNPRTMKELQQEAWKIGQGRSMILEEDLGKMPYLKATLKESFRLHPPVPLLVPRESTKDIKLFGYDIPAGTQVIVNAWAIARDSSVWEEPDEFRPERFLNNRIDYKGLDFELIPFGAGRRLCPGITFAETIIEFALANLVYKFDFSLPQGLDMTENYGITVHKKFPIHVIATPCK